MPKTPSPILQLSEAQIQRQILDWLAAEHIFAVRMNSGTQIGSYKGKKWAIHMNVAGTADILAFPFEVRFDVDFDGEVKDTTPTWIEVKREGGKQSDMQKSFQRQVEALDHSYILAYSLEDVINAIK